jgi:DNA-binding response OmpR family regulator
MNPSRTLLFIDDDREFLAAQAAYFRKRGFEVHTADSSAAALRELGLCVPDLIVLDLMMEHSDTGFTLSRTIRRESALSSTPIIMLSGVAAETGHRFGAEETLASWTSLDGFLDKPISGRQLLRAIEQRLHQAVPAAARG